MENNYERLFYFKDKDTLFFLSEKENKKEFGFTTKDIFRQVDFSSKYNKEVDCNKIGIREKREKMKDIKKIYFGKNVSMITKKSFMGLDLEDVIFAGEISKIGAAAFFMNKLEKVEIKGNIKEIEDRVFSRNNISEVILPSSLDRISYGGFAFNSIKELDLSTTSFIDNRAFCYNDIEEVVFSNELKELGWGCFAFNELERVEIPSSVELIKERAFEHNPIRTIKIKDREFFASSISKEGDLLLGEKNIDINNLIMKGQTFLNNY